jgi:voltage-gated potassium channel
MPVPSPRLLFPRRDVDPTRALVQRIGLAIGILVAVALLTWLGRAGYRDVGGGEVSLLDAFYYATVTVTTTGYGDITPVSSGARAMTAFVVTPLRVLFLIVLVGTTIELLTERFRQALAESRWRRRVGQHTIVVGYGTKGHGATQTLLASGMTVDDIVVVDSNGTALQEARDRGFTTVLGDATRTAVLRQAQVDEARAVVVTCERDDTATLVTLSARELNGSATIVAAVRESENAHLLRQSGANTVIVSSEASGRLLGLAVDRPRAVSVIEDLIVQGHGLELVELPVDHDDIGHPPRGRDDAQPIAIVRGEAVIPFGTTEFGELRAGDSLIAIARE